MDWKIFCASVSAIFLAELADKTQLVSMSLTARTGKPVAVLLGSIAGYALVTVLSVLAGALLGKMLKPEMIRSLGGALFILIGLLMLWGKL